MMNMYMYIGIPEEKMQKDRTKERAIIYHSLTSSILEQTNISSFAPSHFLSSILIPLRASKAFPILATMQRSVLTPSSLMHWSEGQAPGADERTDMRLSISLPSSIVRLCRLCKSSITACILSLEILRKKFFPNVSSVTSSRGMKWFSLWP